jgi:uncharacterized protein (TIGR01777 family)
MAREIVVTGASGWIPGHVAETLADRGWTVTGVSRTPDLARERRPDWTWIGTGPELDHTVRRIGVVLNLAGRHPFEQPWTAEFVAEMRASRIDLTRRLVAALRESDVPDRVLVNGSGYPAYGDAGDALLSENSPVDRTLTCGAMDIDWESAAAPAAEAGVRLVVLRLGLTFGSDGGPFLALRAPFDQGAGVVLGTGRQWVPWIHVDDAVRLIVTMIEDESWTGPVNLVAPEQVRHADLAAALGEALGVPCETTVPPQAVTAQLGGVSELLLASQRMVPARVQAAGFDYRYPELAAAVKDLVAG